MPFQLIIKKDGKTPENLFARARTLDFASPQVTIGGQECDCPLPGCQEPLATICQRQDDYYLVNPGPALLLDGRHPQGQTRLHSGSLLQVGGYALSFQQQRKKAAVSRSSLLLAKFAKNIVLVLLGLQVLLMLVVPEILRRGSFWGGQIKSLEIVRNIDELCQQLKQYRPQEPLQQALATAISEELLSYKRYFRDYGYRLTPDQRREIMDNLGQWRIYIYWLKKNPQLLPPLPELEFEESVKHIIQNNEEGGK